MNYLVYLIDDMCYTNTMTIGEMIPKECKKRLNKQYLQLLEQEAVNDNPNAQYKLGKYHYDREEVKRSEYWLERAARNGIEEAKKLLSKFEYPSTEPTPYAASHKTRGGNAYRYAWN
ncbi:MAG: hypothetical protein K2K67_09785 [Treponemataceae bacterium]|nr:hypothetical protein [Treponemataceae bacterium]